MNLPTLGGEQVCELLLKDHQDGLVRKMIAARIGVPKGLTGDAQLSKILSRLTRKFLEAGNYFEVHPSRTGKGKQALVHISRDTDPARYNKSVDSRVANHFEAKLNGAQKKALVVAIQRSSPSTSAEEAKRQATELSVRPVDPNPQP